MKFRSVAAGFSVPKSGCDEVRATVQSAFFRQQIVRIFQTLAALRRFTKRGIDSLCIAANTARGAAKFAFADRIADADKHVGRISPMFSERKLMRIDCNIKPDAGNTSAIGDDAIVS